MARLASDIKEMFQEQREFRELLVVMTRRDLMLRYKQTIMGFGWAVFMPLLNTILFSVIFTRVAKLDVGVPYPIFAYCGLLAWNLTASALRFSVMSLTANINLVAKVYFPREIFPFSAVLVSTVDFAVGRDSARRLHDLLPGPGQALDPVSAGRVARSGDVHGRRGALPRHGQPVLSRRQVPLRGRRHTLDVRLVRALSADSISGAPGVLLALNPMTPIIDAYRDVILYGRVPAMQEFAVRHGCVGCDADGGLGRVPPFRIPVRGVHLMASSRFEWTGRRVFVTGATGIVGSWLVKRLLELGAHVVTLVRDWDPQTELVRSGDIMRTNVVNGRLEDYDTLERAINEHEIRHRVPSRRAADRDDRAAQSAPDVRGEHSRQLQPARGVPRSPIARHAVVVASSDKAYGDAPTLPYTEDMPANGRHPYDVSKSCTDLLALTYAHTYELPVTVARCGNIYGGGDLNWSRIVPGTIRSLHHGERPVIRSNGLFTRDYIYVQDVVDGYLRLAEQCATRACVARRSTSARKRA